MTRKSNFFYTKLPLIFITVAFLFATFAINISSAQENGVYYAQSEIVDGDLIQASGDIDVYIVKIVGQKRFKRLILNPTIFDSYEHLDWNDIKIVSRQTLALYTTSNLVQQINPDGSIADERVFQLFPSGDTGMKRHIALTPEEFNAASGDWDSIYYINSVESGNTFYTTQAPIGSTEEFREILEKQEIEDESILKGPVTVLVPPSNQLPFLPGPLKFGKTTDTTISLSWDEIEGSTGYEVQYRVKGASYSAYSYANIAFRTAVVRGLTPDTSYIFRLREIGGEWLTEQTKSTRLATVGTLNFETGKNQINLSWQAISGASGYEAEYKIENGNWVRADDAIDGIATRRISSLDANTAYTFRVRATGDASDVDGAWSAEQTKSTKLETIDTIRFGETTKNAINLSWNTIDEASGYEVEYRTETEDWSDENVDVSGATAWARGLDQGTYYTFRVRATGATSDIYGAWSQNQTRKTLGLGKVKNVYFGETTTSEINLSWDAVEDATKYDVRYKTRNGSWSVENANETLNTARVTNLSPGTTYTFIVQSIRTVYPFGVGDWSEELDYSTSLAAVGDLSFDEVADKTIKLSWGAISGATTYAVEYKAGSGIYSNENVVLTDESATITNLTPNTAYTFRVKAIKEIPYADGEWSSEQDHTTSNSLAQVENVRFDVTTSPEDQSEINLRWDTVGGATSYHVWYRTESRNWSYADVTVTGTTARVINLEEDTEYTFIVRAWYGETIDSTEYYVEGPWSEEGSYSTSPS